MTGTGDTNYPPNDGQEHPEDTFMPDDSEDNHDGDRHGLENGEPARSDEDEDDMFGIGDDRDGTKADRELIALIDEKDAQIAELNDRFLRLAAELENSRRRAEREKKDAGKYAIAELARDLVAVADNFDRALRFLPADPADIQRDSVEGLVTGLRMTEKELLSVLQRYDVKRIFPEGERFDPNMHQAVAQVPGNGIPQGFVVNVAQPGFTIGERVLRAAMVTVSLGGDMGGDVPNDARADTAGDAAPGQTQNDQPTEGLADSEAPIPDDPGGVIDTKA